MRYPAVVFGAAAPEFGRSLWHRLSRAFGAAEHTEVRQAVAYRGQEDLIVEARRRERSGATAGDASCASSRQSSRARGSSSHPSGSLTIVSLPRQDGLLEAIVQPPVRSIVATWNVNHPALPGGPALRCPKTTVGIAGIDAGPLRCRAAAPT